MPSATISDTDRGYADLVRRVIGKKPVTLAVGILEKDGGRQHGDDPVSILEIAIWNEFGTRRAPARSFIRAWFDEHEDELRGKLTAGMRSVLAGKLTREQLLNAIAQTAVAEIQDRISDGIDPPNAPSTAKAKGSSKPLINRGILRSTISYEIKEGT